MHRDTYVIIPVYNEAKVIKTVLDEVKKKFSNIVCVDDGSIDGSKNLIKSSKVQLVAHTVNLGAGAATQTGVEYAITDPEIKYFITIDADGQHEAKDAVRMLEYLKKNNLDIVFGSRFLGEVKNISLVKKFFLNLVRVFSEKTSKIKLSDPHIGLRVFNRNFAENLKITLPGFEHASEILERIKEGKFKYAEMPVTVTYSDYSKSKGQPMLNAINISFDLLLNRIHKK